MTVTVTAIAPSFSSSSNPMTKLMQAHIQFIKLNSSIPHQIKVNRRLLAQIVCEITDTFLPSLFSLEQPCRIDKDPESNATAGVARCEGRASDFISLLL